jgi:hypothetical protein
MNLVKKYKNTTCSYGVELGGGRGGGGGVPQIRLDSVTRQNFIYVHTSVHREQSTDST